MPFQLTTSRTTRKPTFCFLLMILNFIFGHGINAAAVENYKTSRIGGIIDVNSRQGKEQKTAMEIAVDNFNNNSKNHKLSLHIYDTGSHPLQAPSAADELIKENQVKVIVGVETWNEAALVAEAGNRSWVPVLSFAAAGSPPPLAQIRWPFLVQMATNSTEQVTCIAAIVQSFHWKMVIAIYEDDFYGGDSGMSALLSQALQSVGAKVEYHLVLPPFSFLSDPEGFVLKEAAKLLTKQSRVFVVLQLSSSMATQLFKEARRLGLMGRDSAWIITDNVLSLMKSDDTSMQGAIGIKTYYRKDSKSYLDFEGQFHKIFRLNHPEEDDSMPRIHALRAYDSIDTIGRAVRRLDSKGIANSNTSDKLLRTILSSDFTGLTGVIRFDDQALSRPPSIFRLVNVFGTKYHELGFWSPKFGFSKSLEFKESGKTSMQVLVDSVSWPGDLKRIPKGWAMPTEEKALKIGVPDHTSFETFVKVDRSNVNSNDGYSGFCIEIFREVVKILEQNYSLPYKFVNFSGDYNALVESVANKVFDAVVGDVTILANRSRYVTTTQPYAESGLWMLVPVKHQAHQAWMFLKPFTPEMWIVTGAILIYTTVIVWFLEHPSNPDFRGSLKDQFGIALWFTFSSLFYAHKEKIHSNMTRVVVIVWLFVVLVLTSSYTANLSSILTVSRLEPNVTDIEWLRRTGAPVGCDGDSFVKNYLKDVLRFKPENIKDIGNEYNYPTAFDNGTITAAFLEIPYAKVFLKQFCDKYTVSGPVYRFGGLGFVFQKGSPIAPDVSEAILTLYENGKLRNLEDDWLSPLNCSISNTTKTDSLSLASFWGLYLISGGTSTICFLFFLLHRLRNYQLDKGKRICPSDQRVLWRTIGLALYFQNNGGSGSMGRGRTVAHAADADEWKSSRNVSPSESMHHLESRFPTEIEIPITRSDSIDSLEER